MRLMQLKTELELRCLRSELTLSQNFNIAIESRLNKIEDFTLSKFLTLKQQIKANLFDELRHLDDKSKKSESFISDF